MQKNNGAIGGQEGVSTDGLNVLAWCGIRDSGNGVTYVENSGKEKENENL
mgnify:CR=1 FL=1